MNADAVIAVTMGDPAGVGPEVVLKCAASPDARGLGKLLLVGERWAFERDAERLGLDLPLPDVVDVADRAALPAAGLVETGGPDAARPPRGKPTRESGAAAAKAILRAIDLAQRGLADAIVTAPISKEALHAAGYPFPGHTEMLAHYTGAARSVMMMAAGELRSTLVTTHLALRDVPAALTTERVLETIRITWDALRGDFGIERPRVAVCGLNPHAGESGLFGDEEARVIAPAIEQAREAGMDCVGPAPADAAFAQAYRGRYDAVVAMYHDQANIPVKLIGFETGVNVTLGLPIVRVSPDHGTAYDIAGRGRADAASMMSALRVAASIARRRGGRGG